MINKNFEYYMGTTETAYIEEKIEMKALEEYEKEFGKSTSIWDEVMRFMYGNCSEPHNKLVNWMLNTLHNEIFSRRDSFTQDFYIIETPPEILESDSLKLISILRRAGIEYGLNIRMISSNSFASQWTKHATIEQVQKIADYYGVDLEKTMDSLEER